MPPWKGGDLTACPTGYWLKSSQTNSTLLGLNVDLDWSWRGRRASNSQPLVLETSALPVELLPPCLLLFLEWPLAFYEKFSTDRELAIPCDRPLKVGSIFFSSLNEALIFMLFSIHSKKSSVWKTGCGGQNRTADLKIMSLVGYLFPTPRLSFDHTFYGLSIFNFYYFFKCYGVTYRIRTDDQRNHNPLC